MRIWTAVAFVSLFVAACSNTIVPTPRTADFYMKEGDELFAEKRYEDAIASWEKVRDRATSPEITAFAELKIADTQFQGEHYVEAAVAYEAFLQQHPEHEKIVDVLYRLGISYYREMLSPERDQTTTRNALSAFETLVRRFPDDPRRTEVEALIVQCRDRLAGHELAVGDFYLRKGHYTAAIGRLQPILDQYPAFTGKDEVYFALGKALLRSGKPQEAGTYFNRLYKEYPESTLVKQAQKLLETEY